MSKIFKEQINLPKNVTVDLKTKTLNGPLGSLKLLNQENFNFINKTDNLEVFSTNKFYRKNKYKKQEWNSFISDLKQKIHGISYGFKTYLNLQGLGYKASLNETSDELLLKLGFSNTIKLPIDPNIKIFCPKPQNIVLISHDFQLLTNFAAKIRSYRVPEPYKGKGIYYLNETIIKKEGKKNI